MRAEHDSHRWLACHGNGRAERAYDQRCYARSHELLRNAQSARLAGRQQHAPQAARASWCVRLHLPTILNAVTNIRVGIARTEEAATIAAMSRRLIEDGLKPSWDEARIVRCMRNRECIVLAARDRRRLVGFAIMEFYDEHAHLSLLAVQPGYQKHGIGRQLLEWLEASARTAGIFRVQLELRVTNDAARSFYEKLGYRSCGHKPAYYGGREDALKMIHDLTVLPTSSA
jgi:ribosomal-protein-alanine N-acetyltransferase